MKPIPAVLAAPWAIEPQWLRVVFGVWSRGKVDAAALSQAKTEWEARKDRRPRLDESTPIEGTGGTLTIDGSVAVLSIEGPLFRHASMFTDFSGGTSYDALHRGLDAAERLQSVSSVLLRVNSPGGEADGVSELAKRIAAFPKPVSAYVDGMCASAAYWLASQADSITAEETAEIGSIGVRVGITDYSAAEAAAGIREIEIISSQSPGKRSSPVTDDVIGRIQTRIDDLAELFVGAVASGRGVKPAVVLEEYGQGDVMIASKALAAGMIDAVGNFPSSLAASASKPSRRFARQELTTMSKEVKPQAGDGPEWQCAKCEEHMGSSAKAFCAKCAMPDDCDEDEEDAKALGLDLKASSAARRIRMESLAGFAASVLEASGATSQAEAIEKIKAGASASSEIAQVRADAAKVELRAILERGIAGAPGQAPRLSLGAIQKSMASVLRGAVKRDWAAAMEQLSADADEAKSTLTASQIIAAACSVQLSAEDIEAIGEYVATAPPIAASTHVEPARNVTKEDADLDETALAVKTAADKARKTFARGEKPAAAK